MHVRRGSLVETRVGDCYDLAVPLVGSPVYDHPRVNDLTGDVVADSRGEYLLDLTDFVDRCDAIESARRCNQAEFPNAYLDTPFVYPSGVCDAGLHLRSRIDVRVQHDIDLAVGSRATQRPVQ